MQSTFRKVVRERRNKLVEVSTLCAEKVYLELRVPKEAYSIHEVVFRTLSHDQGYSGEPQYYGTYKNSFTWFVASVATPGGQERLPRKVLHHNVHADATFRSHELCWRADDQDQVIAEWINAIQGGDAIQIIPVAQYPAWINFVQEAEIEIHYILAPQNASTFGPPAVVSDATGHQLYRSLDTEIDEVRLIRLNPGPFEDPISCSITYTSLKRCTDSAYEALSYCWGDHRQRKDIKVTVTDLKGHSEFIMSITLSLYSALQKLRPQNGVARVLWADSICINQNDLDERSSQVSLMCDVYRKAQGVVVWLGQGTELMHKSIMTLTTIKNRYKPDESMDLPATQLSRLHDPLMETVNGEKHPGMYDFVDDWTLFESPWFSRTWVVQEAFNARETTFYCGDNTLNLATMLRVNKCISSLKGLKVNSSHKAMMPPIYDDLFHAKFATGNSQSMQNGILEVLIKGLDLDATDPRDKIFAMLQFGKETQNPELLPLELVPDYRRSVSEVFSSFTKWWIVKHESLRILSAIHALDGRAWQANKWETTPKYDADQPTWSWWFRGRSNWTIGILGLKTDNSYRASADTKPNISLISEGEQMSILALAGIKIDFIESLIPYPYFSPPQNLESLHRAYVGIFDPLNLTGKWQHQLAPENMDAYVFLDDTAKMRAHYAAHQDFSIKTNAVECNDSSFFSTRGGLVGLCPPSARVGDILVVLYGGPVPYVLRELPGPHRATHQPAKRAWDADITNPSPFPLYSPYDETAEILVVFRGCPYNCSGNELISLSTAPSFLGSYIKPSSPIFPDSNEDSVWRDRRGYWHMLLHSLEADGGIGNGPKVGRHAFAVELEGPWYFDNETLAFSTEVSFEDGNVVGYYRRERSQLFFSEDGEMRPLYLTTGAQEGGSGMSYSLIELIEGAGAYERSLGF